MIFPVTETAKRLLLASIIIGLSLSLADEQSAMESLDPAKIDVQIEHRKVVGDQVIRLIEGQEVRIVWATDEAAELHIHGYDIRIDISPDAPVETSFTAHATGRFAVTSHGFGGDHGHGHETLLYIEVYPN